MGLTLVEFDGLIIEAVTLAAGDVNPPTSLRALDQTLSDTSAILRGLIDGTGVAREFRMTTLRSWVTEARRFFRFKARTGVRVRMEGYEQMAVVLRDVGRGGFAILAAAPFSPGDRFRFTFDLPDRRVVSLTAVAVHGYPRKDGDGACEYVSGWRFLLENATADIDRLVTAAAEPPEKDVRSST
jgi:hypothetical protein